jgi:hypothetical protein
LAFQAIEAGLEVDLQLFGITLRETTAVAAAIWEEPIKSDISRLRKGFVPRLPDPYSC